MVSPPKVAVVDGRQPLVFNSNYSGGTHHRTTQKDKTMIIFFIIGIIIGIIYYWPKDDSANKNHTPATVVITADEESSAYITGWNTTIRNMRATTADQARNYAETVKNTANKQWDAACAKIDTAYAAGRTPAANLFTQKDQAKGMREAANAINGGTYGHTVLTAPGCTNAPKF